MARPPRFAPPRGFTLVEMIAVLAIVGVVAGLTAASLVGARSDARARDAAAGVHALLMAQRVRAMDRGAPAGVTLTPIEDDRAGAGLLADLVVDGRSIGARAFPGAGLSLWSPDVGEAASISVTFDTLGRTPSPGWRLIGPGDPPGRIWSISFDPIAGTPRLARLDD